MVVKYEVWKSLRWVSVKKEFSRKLYARSTRNILFTVLLRKFFCINILTSVLAYFSTVTNRLSFETKINFKKHN